VIIWLPKNKGLGRKNVCVEVSSVGEGSIPSPPLSASGQGPAKSEMASIRIGASLHFRGPAPSLTLAPALRASGVTLERRSACRHLCKSSANSFGGRRAGPRAPLHNAVESLMCPLADCVTMQIEISFMT
jgi:hypothetical protein